MNNKCLLLALSIGLGFGAYADVLTPEQALGRLNTSEMARKAPAMTAPRLAMTTNTPFGEPAVYVFTNDASGSYMILPADDAAIPMLGYSDAGAFNPSDIPPQMQYWLDGYTSQIAAARARGISAPALYAPADWEAIAPQIKSKWNQNAPYNNDCPKDGNANSYTGCVATSMAQVMNYFKYPARGKGSNSYYSQGIGSLRMSFGDQDFDWDNMLDVYQSKKYTDEQAAAVAYLMKACGYSVDMQYSSSASGTQSALISGRMIEFFDYDGGAVFANRLLYSTQEWTKMIYDNLKNVGPVIYNGRSPLGGHSFICDGYDGNGYFHFNWGWGGENDGYYTLNALNPSEQGIGGYEGGFNAGQDAVLGLCPNTGKPFTQPEQTVTITGNLIGSATGMLIDFRLEDYEGCGWCNRTPYAFKMKLGAKIEPIDGTTGSVVYKDCAGSTSVLDLDPGTYYMTKNLVPSVIFPSTLSDGRYKLTIMCRPTTDSNGWRNVNYPYGYHNYIYVTKEGNKLTIENLKAPSLTASNVRFKSQLFYGYRALAAATLTNNTDLNLTNGVCIRLLKDGTPWYLGEGRLVDLAPGESIDFEWPTNFTMLQGAQLPNGNTPLELDLELYDPMTDTSYGTFGTVEYKVTSSATKVVLDELAIDGATPEEVNGVAINSIMNPANIGLKMKFSVSAGYFASPIIAVIYSTYGNKFYADNEITEIQLRDLLYIGEGESEELDVDIHFPEGEKDQVYLTNIVYLKANRRMTIGQIRFRASESGIGMVADDEDAITVIREGDMLRLQGGMEITGATLYSINGNAAAHAATGTEDALLQIDGLAKGIYLLNVTTADGASHTVKVAL